MPDDVRLLALDLPVGETIRTHCPRCGGGTTNEKTFTITRTGAGKLGYFCHRASCGYRGMAGASVVDTADVAPAGKKTSRWYTGRSRPANQREVTWYGDRFGMPLAHPIDVATGRFMYALRSFDGRTWGFVGRAYNGAKPKALTYWRDDTTPDQLAWCRRSYYASSGDCVLLTEDIVSAEKLSLMGLDVASLLGTHLSDNKLLQLLELNRPVVLALDPDRAGQLASARIVRELKSLLPVTVLQLTADPKDMTFDKLGETLVRAEVIKRSSSEPTIVQEGGTATRS